MNWPHTLNIDSSLVAELRDKSYRDAYVASLIRIGLPLEIRALRKSREWTQPQLAEYAGMAQPRISEIEKPGERRLNIETLLRLASAFDVGLQVRFVPFSELIGWSEALDLDDFSVETFEGELKKAEKVSKPKPPKSSRPRQDNALSNAAGGGVQNEVVINIADFMKPKQPLATGEAAASGG